MATNKSTIDFIVDQLTTADDIKARKMFGEYALYCDGKVVALVCHDILYVKITEAGQNFVGKECKLSPAYPGARPSFKIDDDHIDDRHWLSQLVKITADNLPAPKDKKLKINKS